MAVLELLAAAAWTWIISSYLLLHMHRSVALRFAAVGNEVVARSLHLAHVCLARLRSLTRGFRSISERDMRSEKE